MNTTTKKLGLSMALTALLSLLIYTACFVSILLVNEPFSWTGLRQFVDYETSSVIWFKYLGMGCMIVYVCAFLVLTLCVGEYAPQSKRLLASVASAFCIAFCACVCIAYFVQMTSTRFQIQAGNIDGLIQFTQSYNISAINGINMLGWTLFYGFTTLALGLLFGSLKATAVLRVACIANSAIMFTGFIGYLFNNYMILLLTMNLGLGGAGLLMTVSFIRFFKGRK